MTRAEHELVPTTEVQLEERLSRPTIALSAALEKVPGSLIVLGAGGKMGPSLVRMAKRADPSRRVIAVSRWTDASSARRLAADGIEIHTADLLDPAQLKALPDASNVVFMSGQKFGTAERPSSTWAQNAAVPAFVAERYHGSRTVVFSTGNVYALSPAPGAGSREFDTLAPIGEYAYSCLARERIFAAAAIRHGTPVSIVRLNYANDLRYGVLTDLAVSISEGHAVNVAMGHVNVIWQGDANLLALAALTRAAAPEPYVINVAGLAAHSTIDLARALGDRLGKVPTFTGAPAADALLSDGSRMVELVEHELVPVDVLLDWVAAWVGRGGRLLGKPTNFEKRDGRF